MFFVVVASDLLCHERWMIIRTVLRDLLYRGPFHTLFFRFVGKEDLIYGNDSSCYRGLTKPTKAGLVLALVLLSGMVATSPDIHSLPLPSLSSLLDESRHLMGDDVASELSVLVERMAFQLDMSGLSEYMHDVSDQVASSLNNELLPFLSQQRNNLQEATSALPGRFDVVFAQIDYHIDSMKDEFTNNIVSSEAMHQFLVNGKDAMNQVLVNGRDSISKQSSEWRLVSHAKIEQANHHIVQASSNLQGGMGQVLDKGKELIEGALTSFRYSRQAKIDQLEHDFIQDSGGLRAQVVDQIAHSKDAMMLKSTELLQASQMGMDEMKREMLHMNQQVQGVSHQYAADTKGFSMQKYTDLQHASTVRKIDLEQKLLGEAVKHQEMTNAFVTQKNSEFQNLSEAKTIEFGRNIIQETESVQRTLAKVGTEFESKLREIGSEIVPMIQHSSRSLHDKILAFRDTTLVDMNEIKDHMIFQEGYSPIDTMGEILQKCEEGTVNVLSIAKNSMKNQVSLIDLHHDSIATKQSFLKTVLDDVVY